MPNRGLRVEKLVNNQWKEKEGMIDYYSKFVELYDDDAGKKQDVINSLIGYFVDSPNHRVTYEGEGSNAKTVERSGNKFDPDIKAEKDKGDGNNKKFMIVIPSEKPDRTAQYVSDMITNLGGQDTAENQQYLTGLLLLRKCR